jgi:hypothetical protein
MTPARVSWIYRFTSGIAMAGLTVGTFSSTVITNEFGGVTAGAILTALWIVLLVGGRLLVMPYLPLVMRSFGPRRAFLGVKILSVVLWAALGLLLAWGAVGATSLYVTAPVFGAIAAFASTLSSLYSHAYIQGHQMEGAMARMAVVRGASVALGAILAAAVILSIGPAWGIFARGFLELPLVAVLIFLRPAHEPETPRAGRKVWRGLRDDIAGNEALRRLLVLGVGLTIFAMPFSELVVPIASLLRPLDFVKAAAVLVAAFAVGQSLAIFPVARLRRRFPVAVSSSLMGVIRGSGLVIFALVSLTLVQLSELIMWGVLGLGLGMARAASGSLMTGAAFASMSQDDGSRGIVAFSFVCTLFSPLGVLLWGVLISTTTAQTTIMIGGLGVLAVSAYAYLRSRDDRDSHSEPATQ